MQTATEKPTATARAEQLENAIADLRRNIREFRRQRPAVSTRELALAHLGESNTKAPTANEIAQHDDEKRRLDLTLAGLTNERIDIELPHIREELAGVDAEVHALQKSGAEIQQRREQVERALRDIEAEQIAHRFQMVRPTQQAQTLRAALEEARRGQFDAEPLRQRLAGLGLGADDSAPA